MTANKRSIGPVSRKAGRDAHPGEFVSPSGASGSAKRVPAHGYFVESRGVYAGRLKHESVQSARTDLAALDAHVPAPDDDAPELTADQIAGGELRLGGKKIGRPKAVVTKERVTLRLDPEVLGYFRSTGEGWQTRINDALLKLAKRRG